MAGIVFNGDFTGNKFSISGSDQIASILPYLGNFLYVANFTKNAIELYDALSGIPLNIFTRKMGVGSVADGSLSYVDSNAVNGPLKMFLVGDRLYLCNLHANVVMFDLSRGFTQIRFSDGEIGNEYLDVTMLHYHPLEVSVSEKMDRIVCLYQRFGYVIYDGKGSRLNTIELGKEISYRFFTYFDFDLDLNQSYLKTLHLSTGIITKYDKNGIITNFNGDDYGNETGRVADCAGGLFVMQAFPCPDGESILLVMSNNMLYLTRLDGTVVWTRNSPIPLTGNASFMFDLEREILWFLMDQKMIFKIDCPGILDRERTGIIKSNRIPFMVSYNTLSPYYPTTNMEVIQYMSRKHRVYNSLLKGVDLSKKYMSENKEFLYLYHDVTGSGNQVKIPHYELIFAIQQKFMLSLAQYRVDPYIIRMPQHFGSDEYRDLDKKYAHYCGPGRRTFYLGILQLYEEALFYQKFLQDLRFVVEYDNYQNLTDDVKLVVSCEWNGRRLFPRVYGGELRKLYNKKQCEVLRKYFM